MEVVHDHRLHRLGGQCWGQFVYGAIQLTGEGFYALLSMRKEGRFPPASAPTTHGQRFYGFMDYQQMAMVVDLLRNEKPVQFGWLRRGPQSVPPDDRR